MSGMGYIVSVNPNVHGGTPVFTGTRVPIESLYEHRKWGRSIDCFLEQFATVQRDQIETLLDDARLLL